MTYEVNTLTPSEQPTDRVRTSTGEAECQFRGRDAGTAASATPLRSRRWGAGVFILSMDLVLPVAVYYVLRAADLNSIAALTVSASIPAIGATVTLIREGRVDAFAVLVIASAAISVGLSVVSGNPRSLLAKTGWITGAWGLWMCWGVRATRPPTYAIARPLMEGHHFFGTASWDELWTNKPDFRRIWRVSSALWGVALMIDAAVRVLMAYTLPVSIVPGLDAALFAVTFVILQVATNIYFHRSGLYRMLGAAWILGK